MFVDGAKPGSERNDASLRNYALGRIAPRSYAHRDGAAMFGLSEGGRGTLVASQIATGDIKQLDLAVHGEDAALRWHQ